jgi:peptide/nickel transport system permease protein
MSAELITEAGVAPEAPARGRQVRRRLYADRMAMAGLVVAVLMLVAALIAPLLIHLEGQDATAYHPELLDSARGGVPRGAFGGASGAHWLGVEPTTGRDLFARALGGARISFFVAFGTLIVQILLGVGLGRPGWAARSPTRSWAG